MFSRILTWAVRSFVRGPGKSWIFTSGALSLARFAKSRTGRRKVIDLSRTKPGDKILIEHLPVTHKQQLKAEKVSKRSAKAASKSDKRALKAASRSGRRTRRSA